MWAVNKKQTRGGGFGPTTPTGRARAMQLVRTRKLTHAHVQQELLKCKSTG